MTICNIKSIFSVFIIILKFNDTHYSKRLIFYLHYIVLKNKICGQWVSTIIAIVEILKVFLWSGEV